MSLLGELILGSLLERKAHEFRSCKSRLLYAVCRNLVELALIILFATLVWWTAYKDGLTNYLLTLFFAGLLLTRLIFCFSWNRKRYQRLKEIGQDGKKEK